MTDEIPEDFKQLYARITLQTSTDDEFQIALKVYRHCDAKTALYKGRDEAKQLIINQLEAQLEAANAKVVELEKDANRYRHLRDRRGGYIEVIGPEGDEREQYLYEDSLDAAVDDAIEQQNGGEQS